MADASSGNSVPAWRIMSQQATMRPGSNASIVRGVDVIFVTKDGHEGTVFVPDAAYNADKVRELVSAKAQQLDAIGKLTG